MNREISRPGLDAIGDRGGLFNSLPVGVVVLDRAGRVLWSNDHIRNILNPRPDFGCEHGIADDRWDPSGEIFELFSQCRPLFPVLLRTKNAIYGIEHHIEKQNGATVILSINAGPLMDDRGEVTGIAAIVEEITDQKMADDDREKLIQELVRQSAQLEELNKALKVLLNQREKDKEDLQEKIISNVRSMVLPYLEKTSMGLTGERKVCLDVALFNLNDLFSSLGTTLNSKSYNLTPRELEVANLVKQGKSNKEIADLLDISVRSVESHRRMIRRKLGLKGKDRNLRTYLLSFR